MGKRNKVIEARVVEEEGKNPIFFVKKFDNGLHYSASVRLCDSDKDVANDLIGYSFAEWKCDLQSFKNRVEKFKQRFVMAKHLYKVACESCGKHSNEAAFLERQMKLAKRDYSKIKESYKEAAKGYKDNTDAYLNMVRKMNEHVKSKREEKN